MLRISSINNIMFIYEYTAKANAKWEYRKNEYFVNDFIHGIALSFDEAIEKYNIAYREVGCDRDYYCIIIQHNTEPIPHNNIDMHLRGYDLIKEMPNLCYKIIYTLDADQKIITNDLFFNMYAYIIFHDIEESLYTEYLKFTKGKIIRNKNNGKLYKILSGSESHPLLMSDIIFSEKYSNFAQIQRIDKDKLIGKSKNINHITKNYELM